MTPYDQSTQFPRFAEPRLAQALAYSPVVLVHGPRQCGKSTLAKMLGDRQGYRLARKAPFFRPGM